VRLVYDPSGLLGVMIARPRVAGMLHAAPGHQHDLEASKSGSSADQSGGSQGQTRLRSETSVDGKVKPDTERNPEDVAVVQNKIPRVKTKTRTKAGTSSQQPQNRIAQFSKPDHPISAALGQRQSSRITTPGTALAPRWCPPGSHLAREGGSSG
jgi:hypothetical protein